MNIENIKNKFIAQLLEELNADPKKEDLTADDISLFEYADEFKEFVADEYNIDESELTTDINEMLSMELDELGQFVYGEEDSKDNEENVNSKNLIAGFLNSFLEDDKMKEQIDADGDGKISDEEKANFLNTVGSMDRDDETISLDDIFKTMKKADKDKFKIKEAEGKDSPSEQVGNSGSSGGSSGGGGLSSGGGTNPQKTENPTSNIPDFSKMTQKEVEDGLATAEKDLASGKEIASAVLDGTFPGMEEMQTKIDDAYKNYQDELKVLNEDMAKELDQHVENVEKEEKARNDKLQETLDQTIAVSDAECTYNECVDNTNSLKETLSSLESSLASLQGALAGAKEEEKAAIQAQIAAVQAEIAATQEQITAAEQAEEDAKTAWDEAKEKLEVLSDELTKAEESVTKATETKAEFEKQIAEKYPEIQELQTAYNNSKTEYDKFQAEELSTAMDFINQNQNIKNAAKLELNKRKNAETEKATTKELGLDPMAMYDEEAGQRLKEAALTTRGTTGLCLAGVHESLLEAYGINTKLPFGSAYMATEYFRGNVEGYEEIAQHFQEVEVEESDLSSLPPGAVVIWDKGGNSSVSSAGKEHGHISISLGDGRESSDHIQNQITGRGVKFYVFIPVS